MKEKLIQHNMEILKKLSIPLICLIAFNLIEFAFFLGAYAYGGVKLDSLWSPLSGFFGASALLLSNDARLHPDNAKPKNIAAIVLFVCTFVFSFSNSALFIFFDRRINMTSNKFKAMAKQFGICHMRTAREIRFAGYYCFRCIVR